MSKGKIHKIPRLVLPLYPHDQFTYLGSFSQPESSSTFPSSSRSQHDQFTYLGSFSGPESTSTFPSSSRSQQEMPQIAIPHVEMGFARLPYDQCQIPDMGFDYQRVPATASSDPTISYLSAVEQARCQASAFPSEAVMGPQPRPLGWSEGTSGDLRPPLSQRVEDQGMKWKKEKTQRVEDQFKQPKVKRRKKAEKAEEALIIICTTCKKTFVSTDRLDTNYHFVNYHKMKVKGSGRILVNEIPKDGEVIGKVDASFFKFSDDDEEGECGIGILFMTNRRFLEAHGIYIKGVNIS